MYVNKFLLFVSALTICIISYAEQRLLEELNIMMINSNNNYFLPLEEGKRYYRGINYYFEEKGFINKKNIEFSYVFRQNINHNYIKSTIHKIKLAYSLENVLLSIGKDIVTIGPFEDSLILSNNSPPFFTLNFEYLKKRNNNRWKFQILHGWLDEKRVFNSNPRLILLRGEYSKGMFDFGLTRYSLYGGSNRPALKLTDYPRLIIGTDENKSYSKYDTDGYLAYDITLNLSNNISIFDIFRISFLQSATDIKAFWQKEDKGKIYFPFIVKLQANSYQAGIDIGFDSHIFKLRFASINDLFYIHHLYYPEGYSYKGFALGYPYGRYLVNTYLNYIVNYKDFKIECQIGKMKQPHSDKIRNDIINIFPYKMAKTYFILRYSKNYKNLKITPFIFIEYYKNRNLNPILIDIQKGSKKYIFGGTNFNLTF
ncbi:MAG: capsule assembly Wzi family protein [Nitrososphaerota archaeon]